MKEYTIITGASSGLGYEMALILAQKKYNLLLIARSANKLNALRELIINNCAVSCEIYCMDLTDIKQLATFSNFLDSNNYCITGLINNAGYGLYGSFDSISIENELNMIQLNVNALVFLTKFIGVKMVAMQKGRILNVASILAYMPFPNYSVYSATKSFVLAYSEATSAELKGTGVTLSVFCPGTIETPFHSEQMRKTKAMLANKPMSVKTVAQAGVHLFESGKGSPTVGFINKMLIQLPRFTPNFILQRIKIHLSSI